VENKNQTYIEKDVGHKTPYDDFKSEEEKVIGEDKSVTIEQLHEDKVSCDTLLDESSIASSYHCEESNCDSMNVIDAYGSPLKVHNIKVDVKFDPLLSGATTSVLTTHEEGDILQWHDVISDLFEDSCIMSHHSHVIGACEHEKTNDLILPIDGSPTSSDWHEDIKHMRTDFVYYGIEEVKRLENMNEEWLQKVKEAKVVVANAKKCLQEVKEKSNLINMVG
jgi:hypothetical protein